MIRKLIYNKMKKIILVILFGVIFVTPAHALGGNLLQARQANLVQREVRVASKAAVVSQIQNNQVQNLMQRAQTEITRRVTFLNQLISDINGIQKLSSSEKADLQSQIQTQIDGLNTLQTKISSDTDITTLRADVKSIITNYYIFVFFRVKISLLVAVDRLNTAEGNFSGIYTKLQARINQAQTAGNDVTGLNSLLSDMNAKLTDANTQYQAAETELVALTAGGYPGNRTSLQDARAKIKVGVTDLRTAFQDAAKIINELRTLKIQTPAASSSAI